MVKSRSRGLLGLELHDEVNSLATRFVQAVGLKGDLNPELLGLDLHDEGNSLSNRFVKAVGLEDDLNRDGGEHGMKWIATSSEVGKSERESSSGAFPIPAESDSGVRISPLKYTSLGFEVDLTGSQMSETPFLVSKIKDDEAPLAETAQLLESFREQRQKMRLKFRVLENQFKLKELEFKKRRAERVKSRVGVQVLMDTARERLLTDLAFMVPGSLEEIRALDPSGNGEINWIIVQSWLEQRPGLLQMINLKPGALEMIANYKDSGGSSRSSLAIKSYRGKIAFAVFLCKLDPDTYKDLCNFVFPEERRFLSEVC